MAPGLSRVEDRKVFFKSLFLLSEGMNILKSGGQGSSCHQEKSDNYLKDCHHCFYRYS